MARRPLVLFVSILMGFFMTVPVVAHAEEDTPPDAPYQETVDDSPQALDEATEAEPTETAPTLPSTYASPMTPADPTIEPAVQDSSSVTTEPTVATNANSSATSKTSSNSSRHRRSPIVLTATLTPRAIKASRIWSQTGTATPSLKTTMYASSRLSGEETSNLQRNAVIVVASGIVLTIIGGGMLAFQRKHHA